MAKINLQEIKSFWSRANDGPATGAFAITPDDGTDLPQVARALYVDAVGTVRVTMLEGQVFDYQATEIGIHPLTVTRVWATGTTATGISGLT